MMNGLSPANRIVALGAFRRLIIRRLVAGEVRHIETGPLLASSSHQTSFLRSLQGLPSGRAEARL